MGVITSKDAHLRRTVFATCGATAPNTKLNGQRDSLPENKEYVNQYMERFWTNTTLQNRRNIRFESKFHTFPRTLLALLDSRNGTLL